MLKKLAYLVIILVGIYIFLQIPIVERIADNIRDSVLEKRNNVVEEYDRVKGKVNDVTDKVVETKDKVEDTVDAVGDAVDAVSDVVDAIGNTAGKVENLLGDGDIPLDDTDQTDEVTETCSEEEKIAEICTMDYTPVCGNDGITYGNKCGACASGNVDTYAEGECAVE